MPVLSARLIFLTDGAECRSSDTGLPATAAAVAAGTVHVSPQGNDGNDGLSWATAKLTVSGALAALPAGGIIFLAVS